MGRTSSSVKQRYKLATYKRYEFIVRKDSELFEKIEKFREAKDTSLNSLMTKLLTEYFQT